MSWARRGRGALFSLEPFMGGRIVSGAARRNKHTESGHSLAAAVVASRPWLPKQASRTDMNAAEARAPYLAGTPTRFIIGGADPYF